MIQRFTAYRRNPDNEPQFEGVIWTDGTVTLRWLTACRSTSVWANLADCLNIHGHPEYGTLIEWHDGPAPPEWLAQIAACEQRK
jgi:hypothetical protein